MRHALYFTLSCMASVVLYVLVFAFCFKKPMTIGFYGEMLEVKRDYVREKSGSKLFLLGGSNVRVSHSAEVIETELGIPVVNGGLTAAVSLDFVVESFKPMMTTGDWVYMPLEYSQYSVEIRDKKSDSEYWLAYDRSSFLNQSPRSMLHGLFSFDLPYVFSSVFEMGLQRVGVSRRLNVGKLNANGDQIGHDRSAGEEYREAIENWDWSGISVDVITEESWGLDSLREFLRWAKANEVKVVGGLPTVFDDQPIPDAVVTWIESIFVDEGQFFVALENRSTYPRDYFFDTPYHLMEPFQQQHSRDLAARLSQLIKEERTGVGVASAD